MKRRPFLNAAAASFALPQILIARSGNPMDRIAMTSVTFRFRFSQTSPDGKGDLVLTDIPAYFADEFGLTNVELWSKHFESQETSYLDQLKAKLTKAKTKLINVQVDEKYNLSDKDPAKRTASIDLCRGWIDTTAYLGAPSLRVNSGRGEKAICIESLKELTTYAKNKGLILLVENHGGLSSDPDQLLSLIEEVGDPDIRILADYANWPADADIYTALKKVYPTTHLISAKTKEFNAAGEHISYDFDKCTRLAEEAGFTGIYSAEQWAAENNPEDFEKAAHWMIERLREGIG
ncbi:MAG: sugar phosphate isomerase/epimerase [Verrucomicrobiales bacterium]|nr:sugar phosphate isomerase/epimerase [Verrucomicrobiales bacterium]